MANAVLDGADAMMPSGETAVGRWPTETVKAMALVIAATEQGQLDVHPSLELRMTGREEAIRRAAIMLASTAERHMLRSPRPVPPRGEYLHADLHCFCWSSPLTVRCRVNSPDLGCSVARCTPVGAIGTLFEFCEEWT